MVAALLIAARPCSGDIRCDMGGPHNTPRQSPALPEIDQPLRSTANADEPAFSNQLHSLLPAFGPPRWLAYPRMEVWRCAFSVRALEWRCGRVSFRLVIVDAGQHLGQLGLGSI
jgi:hypothetical protein